MTDTPKKTIPMPMTSTRAPATPAPAADEAPALPEAPAAPAAPATRDPACGAAGKHLANCACTGEMRGPF